MLSTEKSTTLKSKTSWGTKAAFKTYTQWVKEKYERVRNLLNELTKC